MITITAIIRAKPDQQAALQDALLDVAAHMAALEPGTLGFHLSQSIDDPAVFTTFESFIDEAAKERHNASEAAAQLFAQADQLIEGDVILHTCHEVTTDS